MSGISVDAARPRRRRSSARRSCRPGASGRDRGRRSRGGWSASTDPPPASGARSWRAARAWSRARASAPATPGATTSKSASGHLADHAHGAPVDDVATAVPGRTNAPDRRGASRSRPSNGARRTQSFTSSVARCIFASVSITSACLAGAVGGVPLDLVRRGEAAFLQLGDARRLVGDRLLLGLDRARLHRDRLRRRRGVSTVERRDHLAALHDVAGPHQHRVDVRRDELRPDLGFDPRLDRADVAARRAVLRRARAHDRDAFGRAVERDLVHVRARRARSGTRRAPSRTRCRRRCRAASASARRRPVFLAGAWPDSLLGSSSRCGLPRGSLERAHTSSARRRDKRRARAPSLVAPHRQLDLDVRPDRLGVRQLERRARGPP